MTKPNKAEDAVRAHPYIQWHGANWTFIIWGALNAIFFLPLLLTNKNRSNLESVASGKYLPTVKEFFQMMSTFLLVKSLPDISNMLINVLLDATSELRLIWIPRAKYQLFLQISHRE